MTRETGETRLSILGMTPQHARVKLGEWLRTEKEPSYRLNQIMPRLWQRPVRAWADATELPAALRAKLEADWPLERLALGIRQESSDGTVKYLWRLPDGGPNSSCAGAGATLH